jgi:hypothetical protein
MILLYGYRSDLRGNTSTDSIQDHAARLLIQLQHIRSDEKVTAKAGNMYVDCSELRLGKRRPIIFICHCLGGLLLKKVSLLMFLYT